MDNILTLPEQLEVEGKLHDINYDFRPCISIMQILERTDLTDYEKIKIMVGILFVDEIAEEDLYEAAQQATWFLNLGGTIQENSGIDYGRLFSWEQDGRFIFSATDRVLGFSSRRAKELHWWDFVGAFYEIGECTFSTIIHQRKLKKKGKQTEADREWWSENKDIAQLRLEYTPDEEEALKRFNELLMKGGNDNGRV